MRISTVAVAGLCLVLAAGCGGASDEDPPPAATTSETPTSETPSPEAGAPQEQPRTLDLRYEVRPRSTKLFQVNLPPQQPGGTLVTWSAFFQGIGTVAGPADPVKAECYVVQSTGEAFEDRVFYLADDSAVSTGFDISLSGSGVVDVTEGERLVFECEIDENSPDPIPGLSWQTHPQQPIQVTLTPVTGYEQRRLTIK